jgi:uncharacterized repeat protein (TIGR01451 family)
MSCLILIRNGPIVRVLASIILIAVLVVGWPGATFAAQNTAIDPGGGGISLLPSGPVTVNAAQFALVKQARDPSTGAVIPDGSNVIPGQTLTFVLFVDNTTPVTITDIRITDIINEAEFTYIPNSIETRTVGAGASDVVIWGVPADWLPLTDSVGGPDDLASITDSVAPAGPDRLTVGAVPAQANQTLDIPGSTIRAIRFRVTVN